MWISRLNEMCSSKGVRSTWLSSAVISVTFNDSYTDKYHQYGLYGQPCTAVCEITSDLGRSYSAVHGTRCMPFSTAHFSRSTRRKCI